MRKKKEKLHERYQPLFEMANLVKKDTGLNAILWIFPKTGKEKHGARIKVRDGVNLVPLTISDNPEWAVREPKTLPRKTIKQIVEFVKENKTILMRYWLRGEKMSIRDVLDKIKKSGEEKAVKPLVPSRHGRNKK